LPERGAACLGARDACKPLADPGDDRDAVVKAARKRLFLEVNDTAAKALAHVLADSEATSETTG
jgi:hypothetical protein